MTWHSTVHIYISTSIPSSYQEESLLSCKGYVRVPIPPFFDPSSFEADFLTLLQNYQAIQAFMCVSYHLH